MHLFFLFIYKALDEFCKTNKIINMQKGKILLVVLFSLLDSLIYFFLLANAIVNGTFYEKFIIIFAETMALTLVLVRNDSKKAILTYKYITKLDNPDDMEKVIVCAKNHKIFYEHINDYIIHLYANTKDKSKFLDNYLVTVNQQTIIEKTNTVKKEFE